MAVLEAGCNSLADSSNNFISVDGWRKVFASNQPFSILVKQKHKGWKKGVNFERVKKKEAWRLFFNLNRFWNIRGCYFVFHMDDSRFWMLLYMICILKGQLITAAASMVFGCKSSICDKNLMLSFTLKKLLFTM